MVFQRPTLFPGSVADNLAVAHPGAGTEELSTALKRVARSRPEKQTARNHGEIASDR